MRYAESVLTRLSKDEKTLAEFLFHLALLTGEMQREGLIMEDTIIKTDQYILDWSIEHDKKIRNG